MDAAVNSCREVFEHEVKAGLIAAAIHLVGMENVEEEEEDTQMNSFHQTSPMLEILRKRHTLENLLLKLLTILS